MRQLGRIPGRLPWLLVRLRRDESGTVMVFFCVVAVVLVAFLLSVLNLGAITNEKLSLQNAADFSVLSASTWEARAMNMEALFNNTISAGIVLQVANSLMTGVEPVEMPPAWIRLQESAQRWIQDSFNTDVYTDSWGVEHAGFGSWMAALTSKANGDYPIKMQAFNETLTEPDTENRVPLYAYRYRFFDQDERVNPVVAVDEFLGIGESYLPNTDNLYEGNTYYRIRSTQTPPSDSRPSSPEGSGYIVWKHTMTLKDAKNDPIWPENEDLVHVFSSGELPWVSGAPFGTGFSYNLIDDLGLSASDQVEWAKKLKEHIKGMIEASDVTQMAVYNVESSDIKTYLKTYVDEHLVVDPQATDFESLFKFPSTAPPLDIPVQDKQSRVPTSGNEVHGHLYLRIIPRVTVGVSQNEVRGHFVDKNDGQNINDAPSIRYLTSELRRESSQPAEPYLRYYDKGRNQEFWFKPRDTCRDCDDRVETGDHYSAPWYKWVPVYRYTGSSKNRRRVPPYRRKVDITVTLYKQRRWITLPDGRSDRTRWYRTDPHPANTGREGLPSKQQAFDTLWPGKKDYYRDDRESDLSAYHYDDNGFMEVVKRRWYYYSFGVQFDVTVKAYLNIDFSTMLMAKYTRRTKPLQMEGELNASIAKFTDAYQRYGRISSAMAFTDVQPLPFGGAFFRIPYHKLPDTMGDEQKMAVAKGTIPPMYAPSAASTWQRNATNGSDESDSGGGVSDIIFKMNWYSKQVHLPNLMQSPSTQPEAP